ncbi:TonB-dependent receptor plug domain-containing protein [Belliella pelovolcani]|uniref:TonB-dependent outer membrane receptor, SusC/RagA subfamily, signature region n=1 Tax=Belliella pelovolcani TaxID=529505 RepID=A0A1N7JIX4_9BACT|nr:TonB-dependent receptor plug domain-containing protein [Belliella pelovolcani]SIS49322.1 TonB-dependent outer membrane receptor, SusC/RagA subfamily, signature region [Belliella pelovolcani]
MRSFYKRSTPLLIFITGFVFLSFQQNEPLTKKILEYFTNLQAEFPTEKVHLHLDKSVYTFGEDIWFSAYLTAGGTQVPSPLSKTLYVDLFDSNGELVIQKKVLIEEGFGNGDFKLPDFGKEGVFQIKAYTAWMENFGAEYFYSSAIEVFDAQNMVFFPRVDFEGREVVGDQVRYNINVDVIDAQGRALSNKQITLKAIGDGEEFAERSIELNALGQASLSFNFPLKPFSNQFIELSYLENDSYKVKKSQKIPYSFLLADVQFLPEGGHLVSGYKSQVAFKGLFPDGSPVDFEGELLDESQEIKFSTFFGGMGKFELKPEYGTSYKVKLKELHSNEVREVALPKIESKGLVMQVINNPELAYITVFIQGNELGEDMVLVSHTRGMINYMIAGGLNNGIWGVRLPKANILPGINHVTVLSSEGKPLLERLFFHYDESLLINIDVSATSSYSPRSQASLDITTKVQEIFSGGRFSVSIVDMDQVPIETLSTKGIVSELLLNSDLKGAIYKPQYYFKDREEDTLLALDLVMMTNGWRRIDWADVNATKYPPNNRTIEQGLTLEGIVKDKGSTKRGLKGGEVTFMVGNGEEIIKTNFGENGRFIVSDLLFFDSKSLNVSAKDERLKDYLDIEIFEEKKFFEKIKVKSLEGLKAPQGLLESFPARRIMTRMFDDELEMELDVFEIKDQSLVEEKMRQVKIYGEGDAVLKPENIVGSDGFVNIFQMIQGRVAGVQVTISGMNASVLIRGVGTISSSSEPLYLLNNIQVDAFTLMQVNPRDVSTIDVFKDPASTAIFGSQGSNGIIAVYTKIGDRYVGESTGSLVSNISGYSAAREFYQPNYETKTAENAIPDKRSTIYWNPNLKIDESGKAKIKYYNTDIAKKHLIVIEGMDAQGRLARFEKILE